MYRFLSVLILMVSTTAVMAEKVADNVVIASANETYTFVNSPDGVVVKSVEQAQYEALRHSDKVVPHTYYNNNISLDKVSGGKPQYRSVNAPNIFHDGSQVCYFPIELKSAGSKAKSEFRLTYKDAALFSKIPLSDVYPIREKTVRFDIPASLPDIDFVDLNFPDGKVIRNESVNPDGSRTVTYVITDLPAISDDPSRPYPLASDPFIIVKGYFKDLQDLYEYDHRLHDVDTVIPDVSAVLDDALRGATERDTVIDRIYRYVQRKVRYVAYEEGEAAFRPDLPAEVLRKNYGDCKGMALLLAALLNRVGIEADMASIGTHHIPFNMSDIPALAAANHMICVVPAPGDTLFLDATCEYISSRDIPGGIQGKEAMMYTADGYRMVNVPLLPPDRSSEHTVYEYRIGDGTLDGTVTCSVTGDMLEGFLSTVHDVSRSYKDDVMNIILRPRKTAKIDASSVSRTYVSPGEYVVKASLADQQAVTDTGDALYVDLSTGKSGLARRVDLTDRQSDLRLSSRGITVQRSLLEVPDGYRVGELPGDFHADCEGVTFDCRFSVGDDGRVCVEKSLTVDTDIIPRSSLERWNSIVAEWNATADHQIELLKD